MEPVTHIEKANDNKEWNESYYFCFADKRNNIKGMTRIGFKPNKPEGMSFLFLFFSDGTAAGYHTNDDSKEYSNPLTVGDITHSYEKSNNTWKYTFNGSMIQVKNSEDFPKVRENPELIMNFLDVNLELTLNPLNEPYEYSEHMTAESLEIGKKAGDFHWEQLGIIRGSITIDGEESMLEAMGQRDHTFGIRDWTGVGNWLYYVIWFNEDLAINPAAIVMDDGRMSTGGFLFKNGENIPLRTIEIIDQQFRKDGIFPVSSTLEITDKDRNLYILKGRPGAIIPLPFKNAEGQTSYLIQAFGEFELNEIKGGYGTFETLRKAC